MRPEELNDDRSSQSMTLLRTVFLALF